jgi:acetaldehyde dehydrogenase (acetylating)
MDRLLPPRRDRSVAIDMPKIEKAADLVAAAASITANVASGELTPGEGADLAKLVESTARAVEVHEFAERLAKLEAQAASKGNP